MTNLSHVDQLAANLTRWKDAYYNGTPLVTDAVYDAAEDEMRRLDPGNPVLLAVGAPAPSSGPLLGGGWPKAKHTVPMSSLNKAQPDAVSVLDANGNLVIAQDMEAWHAGCNSPGTMIAMDKLDGLSIDLEYHDRKLVRAITRGDGVEGEDITRNVLLMKGAIRYLPPFLPGNVIPMPNRVYVCGEMVVTHTDFNQYFRGESNPRNTASGTAKRQSDPAKCAHVTVIAYKLMPNGVAMASRSEELIALQHMGYVIPKWSICTSLDDIQKLYLDYSNTTRKSLDYDIDGLVYEVDHAATREALGDLNGRPRGAVAYKFAHEAKPTFITDLRWQVGASGRVTPVVEFDTVQLAGALVKQASLHNISNIASLVGDARHGDTLLRVGDQVIVARNNDVIPQVQSVIGGGDATRQLTTPTECPSCKSPLTRDGEYLVCRNEDCDAQASGAVKRWCQKIGVLHVGDALIETLIEAGMVADAADLYTLDPALVADLDIGGRRVGGTGDKAIHNLNAKKTMPVHVLVGSIGIPMIGRSMAKTIADGGFDTLSKMMKARISEVAAIPGVGPSKAEAFVKGFQAKAGLIAKLLGNGIEISVASGALVGQSMCQTGFRDASMVEEFEKQGGTIKSSASKGTTYLVALDPNGNSGKLASARKNGVQVIGVNDMWDILGGKK